MAGTAVIFPGQGSQFVGMGRDIADVSPRAQSVFDRASKILGFDIGRTCFEGPAEELERTDVQQPAILVTSIAYWEAFLEAGGSMSQFACAGGLSLGEYTALHVAGALDFENAVRLVHRRGQLMQEAAEAAPSGMVSLIGANPTSAAALCRHAAEGDVLEPANFNCPGQVVVSGTRRACERAVGLADEYQCRAVTLPVAGAFHSPIMDPAARQLRPLLEQVPFLSPVMPVIANVTAEYYRGPATIPATLAQQITYPVLWQKCVEKMVTDGITEFVEVGPGRVLTGMMRRIDRNVTARNIGTLETLNAALSVFAR
jgi:[acyl-carrier-protein] S-malonyltransferase